MSYTKKIKETKKVMFMYKKFWNYLNQIMVTYLGLCSVQLISIDVSKGMTRGVVTPSGTTTIDVYIVFSC